VSAPEKERTESAMRPLRETAYHKPAARPAEICAPVALPAHLPVNANWTKNFLHAAVQALSPSAVREFFRELDATDALLARLGWALLAVIPVFAVLALLTPGAAASVNPWIKPIKFSLSFSTFVSTITLFLVALRIPEWQLKFVRRAIAVSVVFEILSLAVQAWRSAYAAGAHTWADGLLAQVTNSMVMINTAIVVWMLVLFCATRVKASVVDYPMLSAIRYSIVIFLAGNAVGGYMLARGSHTVGAPDGGAGLPFLNWSTIAGDLRIAHFIAIHAIQIVPLFAYILSQMAPVPNVKQRRMAVAVLAIMVSLAVGATFVQAALGRPLLALR
jgi:hypothetical protein